MRRHAFRLIALLTLLTVPLLSTPGTAAAPLATPDFQRTWARTDKPVADLAVSRTWMWGPDGYTGAMTEPYVEAPGGQRTVQYFDKSRMEDNSYRASDPWDVTNGLLVVELMTGETQIGDTTFQLSKGPASVNVGGDADDPTGPTYATMAIVKSSAPLPNDTIINQRLARNGTITTDAALGSYGVTAAHRVTMPNLDHQVASVFWTFMNSAGTVWENGGLTQDQLFLNPFYATGYPVTEAYWANIKVGGVYKDVLMQCFERRCLTYTPGNPSGWQVEAGNVGQHYYSWRYVQPAPPASPAKTVWIQTAPAGSTIQATNTDWQLIPDMQLTVDPATSGPLAISFSAVAHAPSRLFVRALVDGQRADPTEVVFNKQWIGAQSFTFVVANVTAGSHQIQVQGHVEAGQTANISERTISVTARHPDAGFADLSVAANEGSILTNSQTGWSSIPDMKATINIVSTSYVTVTFSAHAWTSSTMGRMWVRALFDGIAFSPSDVIFVQGGPYGAVSFTFHGLTTVSGTHTIQMQWYGDAMYTASLGNRSLVVHSSTAGTNPEWGIAAITHDNSPAPENSTTFVAVPGMSTNINTPNGGDIAATFSAAVSATNNSRAWVRTLIDGLASDPNYIVFDTGGPNAVHSFTFVTRNVSAGNHSVQVQWKADSGEWLTIYQRSLIVMGNVPGT